MINPEEINGIKADIHQSIDNVKIVDSHEHLQFSLSRFPPPPLQGLEVDLPLFFIMAYLRADLISSGMPQSMSIEHFEYLRKPLSDDRSDERWKEIEPHLDNVRNTIYYRYLLIAFRELYGFAEEDIDDSNWKELSSRIRDRSRNRLEWSLEVLNRMRVHKVILDNKTWLPNNEIIKDDRLVQVVKMDEFIRGNIQVAENIAKRKVHAFDTYLSLLDQAFEEAVKAGAIGIKSVMGAQGRTLLYENTAKSDVERIFSQGLQNVDSQERKMFQDFMMHAVCEGCARYNLPLQIHTGLQAGNYGTIMNTKPTLLTNLFQEYPDVRFIVFHGGYPWVQEAGILAKYFPNVYVDGCWLTHISPAAYRRALDEWLEIAPSSKIFAWGGDHPLIDQSYASLVLAKDLVSEVLAAKVAAGYFTKKVALSVAEKIMGKNAIEVYRL